MAMQRLVLPKFISGQHLLTLGRVSNNRYVHIQLVGEPRHAWCGLQLNQAERWKRHFELLRTTPDICPECHSAIRTMAAELEKANAVPVEGTENSTV